MDTHILELNRITIENHSGASLIFQDSMVSLNGIVVDTRALSTFGKKESAPVVFESRPVGHIGSMFHQQSTGKLMCFFTLDDAEIPNKICRKYERFIAIPNIKCHTITCPHCGTSFSHGQKKCDCISSSNLLVVNLFDVVGLKLYDTTHSIPEFHDRESVLNSFFAGAVGNLIIPKEF